MTRDFDDVLPKDRTFSIRGETFEYVDVAPEIVEEWGGPRKNGKAKEGTWAVLDDQLMVFLKKEDHERWRTLRDPSRPDPITIAQLIEVRNWLWEQASGLPFVTGFPSPSGAGSDAGSSEGA